jgi:hypothetical protein
MDASQWDKISVHIIDEKNEDAVYDIVYPYMDLSDYIDGFDEYISNKIAKQLSELGEHKLAKIFSGE